MQYGHCLLAVDHYNLPIIFLILPRWSRFTSYVRDGVAPNPFNVAGARVARSAVNLYTELG